MKLLVLNDGVKFAYKRIENSHLVSMGIFFSVGSRLEDNSNEGVSHFIEHLAFKGTPTRSAFDIARQVEMIGARSNAFTSKDCTAYYITAIDDTAEKAFEILSDIVLNPSYPIEEIEKERGVVLEEIDMSEDTPDDLTHEIMMGEFFGDNQLGKPILGRKDVIEGITRDEIISYRNKYYTTGNAYISIAGNITQEKAIEFANKYFVGKLKKGEKTKPSSVNLVEKGISYVQKIKDIEQANVTIAFKGINFDNEQKSAYDIMLSALGGGMSSLLFQKLREEQGLCYSVYAYPVNYEDCGVTSIYVGTSRAKLKQAVSSIKRVIEQILSIGIDEPSFNCAKVQDKSSIIFAMESAQSQMRIMGKYAVLTDKLFDSENELQHVDSVTIQQVTGIIKRIFDFNKCVVSYVGKEINVDLAEVLRG